MKTPTRNNKLIVDEEYSYPEIEDIASSENCILEEYGNEMIGEHFIVVKNLETDSLYSFCLTSVSREYNYKCVFAYK